MTTEVKLKVVKSGKRLEIDELSDEYFVPEGDPDRSKSVQDNLTVVELTEDLFLRLLAAMQEVKSQVRLFCR